MICASSVCLAVVSSRSIFPALGLPLTFIILNENKCCVWFIGFMQFGVFVCCVGLPEQNHAAKGDLGIWLILWISLSTNCSYLLAGGIL